jgi:hypothetical protein
MWYKILFYLSENLDWTFGKTLENRIASIHESAGLGINFFEFLKPCSNVLQN